MGAVLVLLTVGFLMWEGLRVRGDQAILAVHLNEIAEEEGSWYAEVEVRNSGDVAAAQVMLEGALLGSAITRTATLDFVPSQSTRRATLVFSEPLTVETLSLQMVSFIEP